MLALEWHVQLDRSKLARAKAQVLEREREGETEREKEREVCQRIRQSRPGNGLGFQLKVHKTFRGVSSSLDMSSG